uniref:ABC1 atypical kinase-like domain-containing protein n=1 Tax=Aureoumbra lagunensis TaxID=44058 RepID=A0A7S3JW51_9STRA|mmetsp:Transcript_7919/g.12041  ORF Transcript_7919/g.12041 Transcript_7919/m.12041 type:complete len:837 (-) Transcript_7919:179-2689(-)
MRLLFLLSVTHGFVIQTQERKTTYLRSTTEEVKSSNSVGDRLGLAGAVSAAAIATTAVNKALDDVELNAGDIDTSWVATGGSGNRVDPETGLPLAYNKQLIEAYWRSQGSALRDRWGEFLKLSVPFLLKLATLLVQDGTDGLSRNDRELAVDAREICQKLGPTFIKLAQTLSVRPDVLPPAALEELAILQDAVQPFDTDIALAQIQTELGEPADVFFSEISPEPVAAASLAQVYKARLRSNNQWVAIKVQRPQVLATVSKDLYVLRRAAEIYQRLIDRFAPQQKTNYVDLLNTFAVGFYSELDFLNEVQNQKRIRAILVDQDTNKAKNGVYVPKVYDEFCTARLAVTEWIEGKALNEIDDQSIRELIPYAQEAFLTQLLKEGFLHADPHKGNWKAFTSPDDRGKLALLDFGLVSTIAEEDREIMISTLVHLANKNFERLVDDFIDLKILPANTNRQTVVPLMDKALSPYIAGGGAQKFQERVLQSYGVAEDGRGAIGGFQAMTQDALTVLRDVPFSIPSYFALLGRALVTLEGIALSGDPDYAMIQSAYPYVSRQLLRGDTPRVRDALREALYANKEPGASFNARRLVALISASSNHQVTMSDSSAFIDLDTVADDVNDAEALRLVFDFVLSKDGEILRQVLRPEALAAADVLSRQFARRTFDAAVRALRPNVASLPLIGASVDAIIPDLTRAPLVLPGSNGVPKLVSSRALLDAVAPELEQDDELFALDLFNLLKSVDGQNSPLVSALSTNDVVSEPIQFLRSLFNLIVSAPQGSLFRNLPFSPLQDGAESVLLSTLQRLDPDRRLILDQFVTDVLENLRDDALARLRPIFSSST